MKCLAIADLFINAAMMDAGLKALKDKGITVEVREWSHESIEKLQEDNLRVEQQGSEGCCLPPCFRALRRLRSCPVRPG
jgi:D-3-phosphoglycerate dehydrogenase